MLKYINEETGIDAAEALLRRYFYMTWDVRKSLDIFLVVSKEAFTKLLDDGYEFLAALFNTPQSSDEAEFIDTVVRDYPEAECYRIDPDFKAMLAYSIKNDTPLRVSDRADSALVGASPDTIAKHAKPDIRAIFRRKPLPSVSDFVKDKSKLLILDNVTLTRNIVNQYKTAISMGVDGVIFTTPKRDMYASGAINSLGKYTNAIPWTTASDWPHDIDDIKESGFKLVAMALKDDSIRLNDGELKDKQLAIVMGNEQFGLEDSVIDACDYTVMIPMSYGVDSLNINCAGTIAMWELFGKNSSAYERIGDKDA